MTISSMSDVQQVLNRRPDIPDLYSVWTARRPVPVADRRTSAAGPVAPAVQVPWLEDTSLASRFIAHAARKEEFLLVLDAAREILSVSTSATEQDDSIAIRMDYAKALMRLGLIKEARAIIDGCLAAEFQRPLEPRRKAELYLLLGDVSREEWHSATDPATQFMAARHALDSYASALQLDPDGLDILSSVASTAFALQTHRTIFQRRAHDTAEHILQLTREPGAEALGSRKLVAEATALAILGKEDAAFAALEQLQTIEGIATADLAEARFHAQFLAEGLGRLRDHFKPAFPPLELIVFAGHATDLPGAPPRFPFSAVDRVKDELARKLDAIQARVGLVSASAGGDLLFAEAMLNRRGTLHLVLPWSRDEFEQTSVLPYEPPGEAALWEPRYRQALDAAGTVREIGHLYSPNSSVGWEFTMEVTAGIAFLTARALRLDIQPMVLWDGRPGRGAGGTESFYELWRGRLNNQPIHLQTLVSTAPVVGTRNFPQPGKRPALGQEVKSMLFADIVGYSKLKENTIPNFIRLFLSSLGQLIAASAHRPLTVNTWGDAIYAVFDSPHDAGWFALEVIAMIEDGYTKHDWLGQGLYWESRPENGVTVKNPINIRIGLHTGPVTMHSDPIVRQQVYTGAHVTRAARIEPLVEPGQAFASEEFAAVSELDSQMERAAGLSPTSNSELRFALDYVGSMQLAKGYPGRHRLYRVSARREFAIEPLAKAAHEDFCRQARARGQTPETNPSIRPWDELTEDLRDANRAQAADIANKLRLLGFELTAIGGSPALDLRVTGEQMEALSIREHNRWMQDRQANGWTYGPVRDNERKHHHLLVPWELLPEAEREKDRDVIRALPTLIDSAGYRIKPI